MPQENSNSVTVSSLVKGKHYLWSLELPVSFEEDVGKDRFFFFSSLFSSEASIFKRREMDAKGFRAGLYATTPHTLNVLTLHRVVKTSGCSPKRIRRKNGFCAFQTFYLPLSRD